MALLIGRPRPGVDRSLPSPPVTLRLTGIAHAFGGRTLFAGVDLEVREGDRVALVGPNGVGKTTLLRIAAGLEPTDTGERHCARGARVALLRQEIDPARPGSVRAEAATAFAHLDELEAELRALEAEMASGRAHVPEAVATRYDELHARLLREDGFSRDAQVERVLEGLGFDAAARERPLSSFSGGWLMRVELAKLLLQGPDVLLLDEPTNHLDLPSLEWFDQTLAGFRGGVVLVSHDRAFLRRHAARVAELSEGRLTQFAGGWDFYLAERERRREQAGAERRAQERKVAETERFIERFRAKASKARQVQSRVKALAKLERVAAPSGPARRMRLAIPPPARAGAVPLALLGVHKAYGEQSVYQGVDVEIRRGDKVALVGPNGAGKSTLLRLLAGVLSFERGERRVGHQVQVAFYAQHQLEALEPSYSVLAELERGAALEDQPRLRSHLGAFLFSGDDVEKKVSVLSGGEKARLALAKLLLRPCNVLVLDEPTNHLDLNACEVLEDALVEYTGTLVLISHDRAFLNAVATRVIEVRSGSLREFPGNYEDYLRRVSSAAPPGAAAAPSQPERGSAPPGPVNRAREARREAERSKRRLAALEADIHEREGALEALTLRLADAELWRDPEQARRLCADRDALRATLDGLYPEWERLAAGLEEPPPG
jgi:ATP-binding cassette, subfamily F, member 3